MITVMLICHSILAVTLVGALTHQSLALYWPAREVTRASPGFVTSLRSVNAARYANTAIVLYLATAFIGGVLLYPTYRVFVRTFLEQLRRFHVVGAFELKENLTAIGLGLLPVYWLYWRAPLAVDQGRNRRLITLLLTLIVWWDFMVGHVINNIRGFGL